MWLVIFLISAGLGALVYVLIFSGRDGPPDIIKLWPKPAPIPLNTPAGIAVDPFGLVYVADSGNHRILKCSSDGAILDSWGTLGSQDTCFNLPMRIAIAAQDVGLPDTTLFITDYNNNRIVKYNSSGKYIGQFGIIGLEPGQLHQPIGICIDHKTSSVLVADTFNNRIQRFDYNGKFMAAYGKQGTAKGEFNQPWDVAVDDAGNFYVADTNNHRVQKFNEKGEFLAAWGSEGKRPPDLAQPCALAIEHDFIHVVDSMNNRIKKFKLTGDFVLEWGELTSGPPQLRQPRDIAYDRTKEYGFLYVVDSGNSRVIQFRVHHNWLSRPTATEVQPLSNPSGEPPLAVPTRPALPLPSARPTPTVYAPPVQPQHGWKPSPRPTPTFAPAPNVNNPDSWSTSAPAESPSSAPAPESSESPSPAPRPTPTDASTSGSSI